MLRRRTEPLWCAAPVAAMCVSVCSAETMLIRHEGAADPKSEGWALSIGRGVFVGPINADGLLPGDPAWRVNDTSHDAGSVAVYSDELTPCMREQMSAYGWTLRTCLVVSDLSGFSEQSISSGVTIDGRRYELWFTEAVATVDVVNLLTAELPCQIIGPAAFASGLSLCGGLGTHYFELTYDARLGSANLAIDGLVFLDEYEGAIAPGAPASVSFGARSACGDGLGEFTFVELVINTPGGPGDFDGDGGVNGADLGLLLGAWNTSNCEFDMNFDGVVDGADLGLLLGAWT